MNHLATIGKKAPLLQLSDWVQGNPTNLDQLLGSVVLIEVFQVNCPGCFLYSLPQAIDLYQKYYNKGLAVIGIATAFEDFDKNTRDNLELLMNQDKVIGETLRVLEEDNRLINGQLPYHIPFPVAMDKITKQQKKVTNNEITIFINEHFPDFIHQNEHKKKQIQRQVSNHLQSRLYTAETFDLYALRGTPSHIVVDKNGYLRAYEFGYFPSLEWFVRTLLKN
jgi:peroxiredoxin